VLAAAAGLSLASSARAMSEDLAGGLTVQLPEANPVVRETQQRQIVAELNQLAAVGAVNAVPQAELAALLDPWLGKDGLEADLPMPALIDVELRRATPQAIAEVRRAVQAIAPAARVNEHKDWLAPLVDLFASLKWLAAALVLLMGIATAATVVLSARAALNTHKATIEVLHLLGSTDAQVALLFQRRIALDAIFGGIAGLALALLVMMLIGSRIEAVGAGLLGAGGLGWSDWIIILALPILGAVIATFSARLTIVNALRGTL
jgi:cell division transport system permease protein